MELPMDCIAFILWMTIVYFNLYIAMSKNRSFIFWFVLSLISGPIASLILMFIIQDRVDYEKTDDIYKRIKFVQRKQRFKLYNWKNHSSAIDSLYGNFEIKELLKAKSFINSEIEQGKVHLTLFSILTSFLITLVVGFAIYEYSSIDNTISSRYQDIYDRYKGVEDMKILKYQNDELDALTNRINNRIKIASIFPIFILAIIFILGSININLITSRIKILNIIDFIIDSRQK